MLPQVFKNTFSSEDVRVCHQILLGKCNKLFVLGINKYTSALIAILHIDGIIDDFNTGSTFEGHTIVSLAQIAPDSTVIVASGGQTQSVMTKLQQMNIVCIDFFKFSKLSNLKLPEIFLNENFARIYGNNYQNFSQIYNMLSDDISKTIFQSLIGFRYTHDLSFLKGFSESQDRQYFEDFLQIRPGSTFVDVGCFDGYTTKEYARQYTDYEKIIALEPDPSNYRVCLSNLQGMRDVEVINMAASSERQELFLTQNGSGSSINETGPIKISCDKLDNIVKQPVSFIKIDTEGFELDVLKGSQNIIKSCTPTIAVAIYHKPQDFYEIPFYIYSLSQDYSIRVRHYTETIYETVMFFLPK
jgi:FkbM family methyltransferase